jgi:hypothetical protein
MRDRLFALVPWCTLASGLGWAFAGRPLPAIAGILAAAVQWIFIRACRRPRAVSSEQGSEPVIIEKLRWPGHG